MERDNIEFKKALSNPSQAFDSPKNIIYDNRFTNEQKLEILHSWEFEAKELEIAEDESMNETSPDILDEILAAIQQVSNSCN